MKIDYDYDTSKFVDKSAIVSLTLNHSEIQSIVQKFEALRNCPKSTKGNDNDSPHPHKQ